MAHQQGEAVSPSPTFADATKVWARIGCFSFGGPAGQIALMHREIVDERKWLSERQFLSALNFCMLLPGPEAMQLATYAGWRLHGVRGGLMAGLLFVLPGALVVLALSMLYAAFGNLPWIEAIFFGVKAAVLAIVIEALLRVARRALKGNIDWLIAGVAFLALYCFDAPFPLIIIAAGLVGFFRSNPANTLPSAARPSFTALFSTAVTWAAIWLVPLALLAITLGTGHVLTKIGIFFSQLAVVTFGGAYAVLSYMAQAAVQSHGWLTAPEMIDGLALAETTPGPLILVTQFVGYLAALRGMGSIWGGLAGAAVTLWMTFAPCFLWVLAGAPYIEHISRMPRLSGALAAITAAVVGVILNLSLWFGLHVLFARVNRLDGVFKPWLPDWPTLDFAALAITIVAAFALLRLHLGIPKTLALCAALGVFWKLAIQGL
ncbi:MAG: chromate efflux transporter [Aestuariivirga sp.]|nr:chromate efflux transporter [Aestuariivirga sp.]